MFTSTFILLSLISLLFIVPVTYSAKILYLHHIGCKSTTMYHHSISKILLDNQHEIFALRALPTDENLANYTDLGVHDDFFKYSDRFSLDDELSGVYTNSKVINEITSLDCENLYRNVTLNETLKNIKVDLVLLELDTVECFLPFVAQFQSPIIGIANDNILLPHRDYLMGNPVNPSYIPVPFGGLSTKMNFFQRLQNTKDCILHFLFTWYYNDEIDAMVTKYRTSPSIRELRNKISLVFTNNHFSFLSKPLAPSTVDIAGIHIGNLQPLPQDIQNFIDGSDNGVIYLSLGSIVKFSALPKHIHDSFLNTFTKLPYRVIWRHDKPEMITNAAKNILVRKWLPQKEILTHPKVILFISHAGIYSTYEAIHFSVPMLTFPVLYDQFTNAATIENLEIGISLDLRNVNEQYLTSNINLILQDEKYERNMYKLSSVFKDRPLNPKDTLIYWINYVIRHKDNISILKPASANLSFYQYLLLDVILFAIVTLIVIIWLIRLILKNIISAFKILLRLINVSTTVKTKTS